MNQFSCSQTNQSHHTQQSVVSSRGIYIKKKDLPPSLKDIIFIKRSELVFGKRVGSGSFGEVFKGRLYDQDVAIKVFKVQNTVSRVGQLVSEEGTETQTQESKTKKKIDLLVALEREVRVLKSVSFCTIVQFYGVCLEPACIVAEYCANQSLFDFIGDARHDKQVADRLTWRQRLLIAYDAACGMNYLHSREFLPALHRDLKSPNLLLDENLNCKICDFNTARFVECKVVTNSIAANNPLWLAPEVLQGDAFTRASDVYPFGVILWELMTWMVPFEADGEPKNLHAVMFGVVFKNERPEIPKNEELIGGPCPVYKEYCRLIERCWRRVPEERLTFSEIKDILVKFLDTVDNPNRSNQHPLKFASAPVQPAVTRSRWFARKMPSRLGRSKRLGKNVEDEIRRKNPNIEAEWDNPDEVDVVRDSGQLPTPFAKGLPAMTSDESTSLGQLPSSPVARIPAIGHPLSHHGLDNESCHSASSDEISVRTSKQVDAPTTQCVQDMNASCSPRSKALYRWGRIRNVVRLVSARRMLARALLATAQVTPVQRDAMNVSMDTVFKTPTNPSVGDLGSIVQSKPNHTTTAKVPKHRASKWDAVRENLCPNLHRELHPNWVLLARHITAQQWLRSGSFRSLPSTNGRAVVQTRASANWARVRETFEIHDLKGYPRSPECWRPLLEVLFPKNVDQAVPVRTDSQQAKPNRKARVCSPTGQTKSWLHMHDQIIRKHRTFLESFLSGSMGENVAGKGRLTSGSAKDKASAVVGASNVSQEKWDFIRDWLLYAKLSSEWDPLVSFVESRRKVPTQDWGSFSDLFYNNKEIRNDDNWGFLKQLFN